MFRICLEVFRSQAVLHKSNAKIKVLVLCVPRGKSVSPYVVQPKFRQELDLGVEILKEFLGCYLGILLCRFLFIFL